jgi:hypothetical protein
MGGRINSTPNEVPAAHMQQSMPGVLSALDFLFQTVSVRPHARSTGGGAIDLLIPWNGPIEFSLAFRPSLLIRELLGLLRRGWVRERKRHREGQRDRESHSDSSNHLISSDELSN